MRKRRHKGNISAFMDLAVNLPYFIITYANKIAKEQIIKQ